MTGMSAKEFQDSIVFREGVLPKTRRHVFCERCDQERNEHKKFLIIFIIYIAQITTDNIHYVQICHILCVTLYIVTIFYIQISNRMFSKSGLILLL